MKQQMNLIRPLDEIIVDNFACGGGASFGAEQATGKVVEIAINHDPVAISLHKVNHPETEHYCEDVWSIDPVKAVNGRPVALCWFSPDCKHFSKAKGGKPVEKKIRGLAWVAVRWAATVKPRVIILENVEEFKTWGPLLKDGMPDPRQKGRTFKAFVNALKRQGYQVDWKELKACDYGAPTIRKRLFLIARRDGRQIVWPEPTHGDPKSDAVKSGKLKPWRTAAEIIDWSLPCPSIFERKKPLAENTLRRIARGIQRFVINNPNPFVIKVNHHGSDFRGQEVDEPLQTITAKNGWGIVTPYISRIGQTGFGGDRMQYPIEDPLTTITTKAEHLLVTPYLVGAGGPSYMGKPNPVDAPIGTVLTENHRALVATFISKYHGAKYPTEARGQLPDEPIRTLDTSNRFALTTAFLAKHYGGNYNGPGASLVEPLPTITTVDHNSLVTAFISKYYAGESRSTESSLETGLHTVTARQTHALVTSHMIKLRGTCQHGQEITEPMPTITAGGLHLGEVRAFLMKYYGTGEGQDLSEPLHTVTTKDKFGIVTIHGQEFQIVDIGMRMLEPHELYAAQGFTRDYIIDRDCNGKKFSKAQQVAMCGNAVPPPFAEHLVRANLPELCEAAAHTNRRKVM